MLARTGVRVCLVAMMTSACGQRSVAPVVVPRDAEQAWRAVGETAKRTELRIALRDGKTTSGALLDWSPAHLAIVRQDGVKRIQRQEIRQISVVRSNRGRSAARGLLIGASAGAAQGMLLTQSNRGAFSLAFAAGWGAIGAGIGALAGGQHVTVVYEPTK